MMTGKESVTLRTQYSIPIALIAKRIGVTSTCVTLREKQGRVTDEQAKALLELVAKKKSGKLRIPKRMMAGYKASLTRAGIAIKTLSENTEPTAAPEKAAAGTVHRDKPIPKDVLRLIDVMETAEGFQNELKSIRGRLEAMRQAGRKGIEILDGFRSKLLTLSPTIDEVEKLTTEVESQYQQ